MKARASFALAVLALAAASHAAVPPAPAPTATSSALALAALDRKIADLDAEEQGNKRELEELGPKIHDAHTQVLARGRDLYKLTRAGMLPVGGGFDALVSHAMKVERARKCLERSTEDEKTLRARGAALVQGLERVARDREALASQRNAMDAARLAMEDEQRRQAAFDRAFTGGGGDYVAVGSGSDLTLGGGFLASKGKLLFPIVGRAEVRPAKRDGAEGPGLEILAPAQSVVRAIFAGHVAFADRYGAYGKIVILDHGEHYYSVSGNLGSIDVRLGDELAAGERIGTVGNDGQGPLLYFEIRHGSATIPPGPWLGL
jgi:septal ring factor EnvC (AmiA/AmiB activator)